MIICVFIKIDSHSFSRLFGYAVPSVGIANNNLIKLRSIYLVDTYT